MCASHSGFDFVQCLILILVNSAALTLLVVISQKFEDTAKKLTVVKNSLWKITGDTYPAMFFNYLLEASILVVPFEALWADMSGHNTLAMTNNQTFGPFGWICWILARHTAGDALKFSDFGITTLGPDWSALLLIVPIISILLVRVQYLGNWNQ